ncbi:hypothetical protein HPG69_017267 [Diceros bicornis minor]|uniref:DUF3496 domain-containing protein n=1 Tax=Diceros bicornis minor TaxID=77932 RepID=A0A7J7EE13_DICBM|nr:hypothetical protein HPG69_017267 [Diceros bicornis minor]
MDIQSNMLKHSIDDLTAKREIASSKCVHLDAENQQHKSEKLEKNKKKLEQEAVNLKSHIKMNMAEPSQAEQKSKTVEKLKVVNLLQTQAAAQENFEQLRENKNSNKSLEIYKQHYLEELKVSTSLADKLNKTNKRLAENRTKLLLEKQQDRLIFPQQPYFEASSGATLCWKSY